MPVMESSYHKVDFGNNADFKAYLAFHPPLKFFTCKYFLPLWLLLITYDSFRRSYGRPQGGQNGHFPPCKIGLRSKKF